MLFNRKSNRRKRTMSSYKVEICGVNTAKLPVLKEEEKDALFAWDGYLRAACAREK